MADRQTITTLSDQPYPDGQGVRALFEEYRGGHCERDAQGYYVNARTAQDWAMWQAALAARQPVGEPVTVEAVATVRRWSNGDRYIDWLTEGGIADLEVGDVLMVSDRAITDEDGSGEVYVEPTEQAVDLHRLVPPLWLSEQIGDRFDDLTPGQAWRDGFNECRTRALLLVEQALIASQAVGNG